MTIIILHQNISVDVIRRCMLFNALFNGVRTCLLVDIVAVFDLFVAQNATRNGNRVPWLFIIKPERN